MSGCSDHELQVLLEGDVSPARADWLEQHLRQCPRCVAALDEMTAAPQLPLSGIHDPAGPRTVTSSEHDTVLDNASFQSWAEALKLELLGMSLLQRSRRASTVALPECQPGDSQLPVIAGLRLLRQIGEGGMGVVYEAFDVSLKRRVAVKMLSGVRRSDESFRRIRVEAEAAARLSHPGIVQVYRLDEVNGQPFIVMEYVGGPSLLKRIAGKPQPPREAAALALTLAESLQFAHRQQVIHRDLKPSNILFDADEIGSNRNVVPLSNSSPKIADFGLAKVLDTDADVTRDGQLIGTPTYAAPEQLQSSAAPVGPAADVYSLGAVLYTMLTGRPPLQSNDLWQTIQMVITQEPVPPRQLQPGVPIDLDTIALRCLMKEPARRYRDAGDLADDLRRFLAGEPIHARSIGRVERAWRWARRNPGVALATSALMLVLTITALGATLTAIRFRGLERERDLQRRVAESALLDSRRSLADSLQTIGLQQQIARASHVAAVCFTEAAQLAPEGDVRRHDNEVRAALALRQCPRPMAVLGPPSVDRLDDLAYDASSRWLIVSPEDRSQPPTLWDLEHGVSVSPPASFGRTTALAWSGSANLLLVGTEEGRVLLTRLPDWHVVQDWRGMAPTTMVAISPDARWIAAATPGGLRWWDRRDERPSPRHHDPAGTSGLKQAELPQPLVDLMFSPDGRYVVAVSVAGRLMAYAVEAPESAPVLVTSCGLGSIGPTRIRPQFDGLGRLVLWSAEKVEWHDLDGPTVVRSEATPPAAFCEVSPGAETVAVGCESRLLIYHPDRDRDFAVETRVSGCWMPDGSLLTGATGSDCLVHWTADFRDGSGWPLFQPDGVIRMRPSPDGRLVTTISEGNRLRVWELPEPATPAIEIPLSEGASRSMFDATGRHLLVLTQHAGARVHRTTDGTPLGPELKPSGVLIDAAWCGPGLDVVTLAAAPDGCRIDRWDGADGSPRRPTLLRPEIPGLRPDRASSVMAVAADGTRVAWITAASREVVVTSLEGFDDPPVTLGVSADYLVSVPRANRLLAVRKAGTAAAHEVLVIGWERGQVFATHRFDGAVVMHVSPGGDLVAIGDESPRIHLLDPGSGSLRPLLLSHPNVAIPQSFSRDGKRLLTSSQDGHFRLWNLETGGLAMPPARSPKRVIARVVADDRAVLALWGDTHGILLSTSDGQHFGPAMHVPLDGTDDDVNHAHATVSPDGWSLAVSGERSLILFNLERLLPPPGSFGEDLEASCRLVSGHRINHGRPVPITLEEWDALWPGGR